MQKLKPAQHGARCLAGAALVAALLPVTLPATPLIYAELAPQAWLAGRLTGAPDSVRVLVPPNHSPELYEPTPRQVAGILAARLYLRCGTLGADSAWIGILQASSNGPLIVECCQALAVNSAHVTDPHAWTDPLLALEMTARILAALIELTPGNTAHYRRNHRQLEQELQTLHRRIQDRLAPLPRRHFLVAHPAWGAFAARYGLVQVSLEPLHVHGGEPAPRHIVETIELARTHGIRAVFVQPGFDSRSARTVARELGVPVRTLSPLHPDYATNLLNVTEQIAATLE